MTREIDEEMMSVGGMTVTEANTKENGAETVMTDINVEENQGVVVKAESDGKKVVETSPKNAKNANMKRRDRKKRSRFDNWPN